MAQSLDEIVLSSLNSWQRIWTAYALLARHQLGESISPTQTDWVRAAAYDGSDHVARAQANMAGAAIGVVDLDEVRTAIDRAPDAVTQWYAAALRALVVDANQRKAFADTDPLYRWILGPSKTSVQIGTSGATPSQAGTSGQIGTSAQLGDTQAPGQAGTPGQSETPDQSDESGTAGQ